MMAIDGTVTDILGYPTLFFSNDTRSPAVSTPINAAVAGEVKTILIINFPFPIMSDSFLGFYYSLAFCNINMKRGNFLISILHRCKLKII